jgi:hypothetical protein
MTKDLSLELPSLQWLGVEGVTDPDEACQKWGLSFEVSCSTGWGAGVYQYCRLRLGWLWGSIANRIARHVSTP